MMCQRHQVSRVRRRIRSFMPWFFVLGSRFWCFWLDFLIVAWDFWNHMLLCSWALTLRLRKRANLSLPHLASLRAATSCGDKDDQGHFAENGVDESRIRKVLANKNIAVVPAQTGSIPSCVTLNSKTKMFELYTCYLVHMLQPMIVPDQGVGKRSPLTSWFRFASFSGPFQSQRKTRCSGVCKRGKGLVVLGRTLIPTQQMEILPRTANLEHRGSWQIFKYVEELLWGCLGLGNQGYKELSPGFRAKMSDGSVAKAWQSSLVLSVYWLLHSWLTKICNLIGWCRRNPWTRSYSNSFSECIFAKNVFFDLWNYANRDPRQVYIVCTCNFFPYVHSCENIVLTSVCKNTDFEKCARIGQWGGQIKTATISCSGEFGGADKSAFAGWPCKNGLPWIAAWKLV